MQCPNCFCEVNTSGACPFCGYDPTGAELRFPLALRPGSILNGRYIVGRVLGQGGFGITYIAPETPAPTSEETPESPVSGTTEDGFKYDLYSDHAVITKYNGSTHTPAIPGEIEGKPVTAIGKYAFWCCDKLTSITIPKGVTSIGFGAFESCTALTNITLPEGVTSIGSKAFHACKALKSITLPEGVTDIESYAFEDCIELTSITIPEGVTRIEYYAFSACHKLTSVTLPGSVASIGTFAFYDCTALTSITLPKGVTSIGNGAFIHCTALMSVTIPESVTGIGGSAFYYCPISQINYSGTRDQWNAIQIAAGNDALNIDKVRFQTQQ